jgi:hypothetical protein
VREIVPLTLLEARTFVAEHHRHNGPPLSWLFGAGLAVDGELVGVVLVGRPLARPLDDGRTVEILRVCTLGDRNAASTLYGAACRAARALGYRRAITYTLRSEPGSSVRASGFELEAQLSKRKPWGNAGRYRYERTLWGEPIVSPELRDRWAREL